MIDLRKDELILMAAGATGRPKNWRDLADEFYWLNQADSLAVRPVNLRVHYSFIDDSRVHGNWRLSGSASKDLFAALCVRAGKLLQPKAADPISVWLHFALQVSSAAEKCAKSGNFDCALLVSERLCRAAAGMLTQIHRHGRGAICGA